MKTCKDCNHYKEIKWNNNVMKCIYSGHVYEALAPCDGFKEGKKPKPSIMPDLKTFKERRKKTYLSLREVARLTKLDVSTISRIERGGNASYLTVKKVDEFYCERGV